MRPLSAHGMASERGRDTVRGGSSTGIGGAPAAKHSQYSLRQRDFLQKHVLEVGSGVRALCCSSSPLLAARADACSAFTALDAARALRGTAAAAAANALRHTESP